jgi:hypothetical protein
MDETVEFENRDRRAFTLESKTFQHGIKAIFHGKGNIGDVQSLGGNVIKGGKVVHSRILRSRRH